MHLNVMTQCCPSPAFEWLWRHPADRTATGYRSLAYWTELARRLEAAAVDALFFADVHGIYDVYGGTWDAAVRHGVQVPSIDPLLVIPAAAAVTERLGFAATYSTTYHAPYECARTFSTLDHLTGGRVAWNVVTSYLRSAADNGLGHGLEHDQRYDQADEYLEVVRALWERSWDDDAVVRDATSGTFTDPGGVHAIDHDGRYYRVRGPHVCEPSPQRTPVLYQAGASPRGLAFAARHAEVVFMMASGLRTAASAVTELRRQVVAAGREPTAVKVLQGLPLMVAPTDTEARDQARLYERLTLPDGLLAKWCGWSGIDLAGLPADTPLRELRAEGTRSVVDFLEGLDPSRTWTIEDARTMLGTARRPNARGALVGSPERIADRMEDWLERTGVDGFNLLPCPPTAALTGLCDLLIPELQRRGIFRRRYAPEETTLRERYFGAGRSTTVLGSSPISSAPSDA